MHVLLASLSASTSRCTMELAALLGLVGGILLAVVRVRPSFQKRGLLLGGLLLVLGFLLLIVAWHCGVAQQLLIAGEAVSDPTKCR